VPLSRCETNYDRCATPAKLRHMERKSLGFVSSLHISPKGRTTIPATARKLADIKGAVDTVLTVDGPGRIVIETAEALSQRVWAAAPDSSGLDTLADVRAMRDDDTMISNAQFDARLESADTADGKGVDHIGAALLAEFGL
jgi:bifunctional DNA-binding transcriptional regulator/antitoxin component of YhaV-PrlF toxin-antitoxin module